MGTAGLGRGCVQEEGHGHQGGLRRDEPLLAEAALGLGDISRGRAGMLSVALPSRPHPASPKRSPGRAVPSGGR